MTEPCLFFDHLAVLTTKSYDTLTISSMIWISCIMAVYQFEDRGLATFIAIKMKDKYESRIIDVYAFNMWRQ